MLEDSSGTLEENATKKRRRRKKKPNTQNLEKDELSNDGNKGKEHCDVESTECQVKVKKKNKGAGVSKMKSENSKASSRVDVMSEVSWTVKEVKEVGSIAVCSEKPALNAVCLVLNENTNCRDKKQLSEKSRRNVKKVGDISVEDLEKNSSNNFSNSGTTRLTSSRKSNKEQLVIAENHKNNKCQTDDSCETELKKNNCGYSDNTRSIPEQTPCQKSTTKRSVNGREQEEMEYKADDNARYTENCGETHRGHSPEGTACNEGNRRGSSTSRRSSFDRSSEQGTKDSDLPENHRHRPTTVRRRRRSFDRSQQKEPREKYSTAKPSGTRTFNTTSTIDRRESESSETYRYPTDNRRIESTDDIVKHDPSGDEYPETHRNPAKHQKRRGSWGRSSRNNGSEQSENGRHYSTENSSRRRSFDRTSESDHRGREESYRHFNNRRRRTCSDSSSGNHAGRSELPENHRYHPSENRSRRSPTNNRSLGESGNLSECEERKPEALVEQSSGMSYQSPPKSIRH